MKQILFISLVAGFTACTSTPDRGIKLEGTTDITLVVDYSASYRNLVSIDSVEVVKLFTLVAKTGGSLAHIPIQSNSNVAPVFLTQIERLDTTNTADERNIYRRARLAKKNDEKLRLHFEQMDRQVSSFLAETRKFAPSKHTDLSKGLLLAARCACESSYKSDLGKRIVIVLSDLENDPPSGTKAIPSLDFCGAQVLVVRPSPAISNDSLRAIFNTDVKVFTTLSSVISFLNQQ